MTGTVAGSPGVLLDRDGTLIREVGYLRRLEQVELLPRAGDAVHLLRRNGLKVAVITNQSGVARGFFDADELAKIHQEIERQLAGSGAFLDAIYYCPHHPIEGAGPYRVSCQCRKPDVGLATRAAAELKIDLARSYVVGDQSRDMELAARIGAKGIAIRAGRREGGEPTRERGFLAVADLWEAAQWIIQDLRARG